MRKPNPAYDAPLPNVVPIAWPRGRLPFGLSEAELMTGYENPAATSDDETEDDHG